MLRLELFSMRALAWMAVQNYFGVVIVVVGYNGVGKDEAVLGLPSDWLALSVYDDAILPGYVAWHNNRKEAGDRRFTGLPYLKYRGEGAARYPGEVVEAYKNYDLKNSLLRPTTEVYTAEMRAKHGPACFADILLSIVPFHGQVVITGIRTSEEFDRLFGPSSAMIMLRRGLLVVEVTASNITREIRGIAYRNEEVPSTACHQLRKCLEERGYRTALQAQNLHRELPNNGSREEVQEGLRNMVSDFAQNYELLSRLSAGLG